MNVFVTGSTGFVGKNLRQYFASQSEDIHFYPIDREWLSKSEVELIALLKAHSCDAMIHLAGKAHDLRNVSDPESYIATNTHLTQKIFRVFQGTNAEVFIAMSSVKAIADSPDRMVSEDYPADPGTAYGKSKLMADQYIMQNKNRQDQRVFILRPCMIHGPGNKGNLNLLYKLVARGLPWPLGAFHNQRSFLSVYNLCFTIHELINRKDIKGGIFTIADTEILSTNEVINEIADVLGLKTRIWNVPIKWIQWIALCGTVLRLPLNKERLSKLTENYIVSNKLILETLNKKLPLTAIEGLRLTIQSFKSSSQ